ncbi:MAG: hypothetical protein EOO36_14335 [Cytophagaceae bacterium]|nr:MAG: hypothetical protein EOO36_14335 [Cytophagaceae bacterium]
MLRQLLFPLLGLGLLFTAETAAAQTQAANDKSPASAAKTARQTRRATRVLTARERKQAEAAAKAAAKSPVLAMNTPAQPGWSGWSNEPVALPDDGTLYHPRTNLSVAPGMPLNQISHGVTTDYNGRPLRRPTTTGTTLATPR